MADPLIDSVVAQYQILSRIGGGAMGVVYQARDLKLGRLVALKFLPAEWSHDDDAKQRFVREAQAASSTDHVNICTVHDIQTTEDGRLFIVMAHYEGQTLKQRLAQGPMPIGEALSIAQQVADGLARAHAGGVVHRDIKPGNVILTEDAVKIVDFGLATLAGSVQLTQAGSPMGTVTYMAPEQLRGLAATAQSDVWAVGAMLYEMLAGHPPFQGAYAEAISYAIRHDTPPLLRELRPEVPEEVEQLVFRALHKEPGVRFASGRELARALRQVQGYTVPLELQTAAIEVPRLHGGWPRRRATRLWKGLAVAALLAIAAGGGGWWYASRPPARTFVAVAPVVNGTGDRTLDPYRLALTMALTRELSESREVRVLPYIRVLQLLRGQLLNGADVGTADGVRAVRDGSGAPVVVVPTLLYDRGAWKARADLQDAKGNATGRIETDAIESSLTKDAAATLISALAAKVEGRFSGSHWLPRGESPRPGRFQSLEAAKAFEEGVNAFDIAEFADARDAFARAAREDQRHPLPLAWQARVGQLTGDRNAAVEAADRAEARLQGASPGDTLFVQAVVAEARRQDENAARLYAALAASEPDDPAALTELAGYQDRSGKTADAVASYRRALDMDPRQPVPALQLCRLYNSTRMNEAGQARAFGERAQKAFASIGSKPGEAQAMLCLSDILRVGKPEDRAQARALAGRALAVFESLGLRYGVGRAQQYMASSAQAEDDLEATADWLEKALASAKEVGNSSLEGVVYTNLGVTHTALGNRGKALEYYRQSYELAERRGDERRAAYSRANAGALLIEYGNEPDEGVRFVEGALRVVRRLGDLNFEVFCRQLMAAHERFSGRSAESRKQLSEALAIARERNFVDAVPALLLDDGRVLMQMGDYVRARDAFTQALASEGATKAVELLIDLARVQALLGDLDAARSSLERAQALPESAAGDIAPRLAAARGEVAYAAGDMKAARTAFEASARLWTDDLPDAASVEARAYVGLIDGLSGHATGRAAVAASLQQAKRMHRPTVEGTARVFMARLDLKAGQPAAAVADLNDIALDLLGPELKAQVHHWRAEAAASLGTGDKGARDREESRRLLTDLETSVPPELRARFHSREDRLAIAD